MIARPATLQDLAVGQEVLYVPGSEYRPATVYHGVVTQLFPVYGEGAGFRAVSLDTLPLPTRFNGSNPLFIIGT